MEQKPTYKFKIDKVQLKRTAAELEQAVLHVCAGCADAIDYVGHIKTAIDTDDWKCLERMSDQLTDWLMRSHDVANLLTIVKANVEFKKIANGEEKD